MSYNIMHKTCKASSQTKPQHDGKGNLEATPSGGAIRFDYYWKRKSQLASVV